MKILAIDGNSIMNRSFYGIKALSNTKGEFTNAIFGFLMTYFKHVEEVKPDCTAVAFDLKAPTFRHKFDSSYKANRHPMPEELAQQMPVIKEILELMGIKVIECEGYEADDILGTISKIFGTYGNECYIVTGDRDSLQLVTTTCTVLLETNRGTVTFTPEKFRETYGFEPMSLIDLKSLMGDSSDNISGVKGIGEKIATALIKEQKTIEKLYENLEGIRVTPSVKKKLEDGKEDAERSKYLATIVCDVPIDKDVADYAPKEWNPQQLKVLLTRLEMNKVLQRLDLVNSIPKQSPQKLKDLPPMKINMLKEVNLPKEESYFIFDGMSLLVEYGGEIYCCESKKIILEYFESEADKFCFEGKAAYRWMFEKGKSLNGLKFCCDLAGYLLNSQSSEYTTESLSLTYGSLYRSDMEEYADICSLRDLTKKLKEEIESAGMNELYYDVELPLCEVLAYMEYAGVRADTEGIKAFGERINAQIDELTQEIYRLAGEEFNLASPKQLSKVLFEDMGLKGTKKNKNGYSTSAEVLESISNQHPIINMILEYRTLAKLSSTYVDSLLKQVHSDGRVHSIFKQTETRTGRISSTEPNMQNIPVRKEIGREMRKFFTAEDGCLLVDADYSQIELRVLASMCGDENMQNAFLSGKDIHTSTAAQVFGLPEDFVTPEMRSAAKAVNFGIVYGIGAYSLSKDIGVSVPQAKKYIQSYLDNYPKVTEFMEAVVKDAVSNGYVTTKYGRRRYIPELNSTNKNLQSFGKRAAMNAPIQGTAADIIKIAMVNVYKRLKEEIPDARLILQVHDELILEVPEAKAEQAAKLLKETMESAAKTAVPLTTDVHCGKSWYDAKNG